MAGVSSLPVSSRLASSANYGCSYWPPRSPKLNGAVERAQRTHTEEFYEVTPCSWQVAPLNQELRDWERIYNTVRPHQALGYQTPQQFLARWSAKRKSKKCH